jgi:hypothetical protein
LLHFWEEPFVKLFTRSYKGKGPVGPPWSSELSLSC